MEGRSRFCAWAVVLAIPVLAGCATSGNQGVDEDFARMLSGQSVMEGRQLEAALGEAAKYPLGSERNPVRATMPQGQRAYLARLRCVDGTAPDFTRDGNLGPGVYGNIVDAYSVTCAGQPPQTVVMDMYHAGYVEDRPVPPFTITAQGGQ